MKLNNINLKKVIPIAAIVIVLVIAIICLVTCDNNRDTSTNTTTTEAEATDVSDIANNETTEEQTTANDTVKDENNTLASVENTSDAPDPQTTVENKTTANNQSTTKKPQSTYKPNNNEKETTTKNNIVYNPTIPQPTTTKNNYSNEEQQTTGNKVIEVGYGLYEVEEYEDVDNDENNKYYKTTEYYAWYEKYADGTIKIDNDRNYMLPQYIDSINYSMSDYGEYRAVELRITDYYSYKYNGEFTGMAGKKSKELYNKYYKEEYAKVTIDEKNHYHIHCLYYIDNKTNKTYDTYDDYVIDSVSNKAISELSIDDTNMSKEKKIFLLLDYINNYNFNSNFNKEYTILINVLNKVGVQAFETEYIDDDGSKLLVQMEDGLWYRVEAENESWFKGLNLYYGLASDFKSIPQNAIFATQSTANLVFKHTSLSGGEDTPKRYNILYSDMTY